MRQLVRWGAVCAVLLALLGLGQLGVLGSLDRILVDWRLQASHTPASGDIVVVEIDSQSLADIGVWPWPRTIYADLLDRLMAAGVDEVAFDIDFSSASTPEHDAAFAAALARAGGYAALAAFAQASSTGEGYAFTRPLPILAAEADPVLVNVLVNPENGRVHSVPMLASDEQGPVEAMASRLGRPSAALPAEVGIDFSIDLSGIDRISVTDILAGRVDDDRLAGKQVIVGASAIELRDFFTTPRYGIIAGPLVQALAAETVKAGRLVQRPGPLPAIALLALVGVLLLVSHQRQRILSSVLFMIAVSVAGELFAWRAYLHWTVLLDTATLHSGLLVMFAMVVGDDGYEQLQGRRAALARLRFLATHDASTALLSRNGLLEQPQADEPLAVVALHVRGMEELRALLGHELVEDLLIQVAHRLRHASFRETARIAPATFALVRRDDGDSARLVRTATDLAIGLAGAYVVGEHNLHVEVTAGLAYGLSSRAELLNRAEIAMIQAGIDRVPARSFNLADQQVMERHRRLDRDLRRALALDQLRLIYQPQVELKTRRIVGAETLMRWEHPELGLVSPAEFIPLAEETGLITDLGRWILEEACKQACAWPSPITVAVNVSPIQFQQDDLVQTVEQALATSGLPPERLELEITESSRVIDPQRVRDVMWRLQQLGIRLSIDDFGTGYSSLSYFRDLPFDTVKIDQGFIRDRTSPEDRALVAAIVELADKMGKHTVAEGVEDDATAAMLASIGCTYGQGYHFSRPVPQEKLCEMLKADATRRMA